MLREFVVRCIWPQRLKPRFAAETMGTAEAVRWQDGLNVVGSVGSIVVRGALDRSRYVVALVSFVAIVFGATGCGYHQAGSATHVPVGVRTLAVPIFQSKVQAYRTETTFTQAVVRELNTRTKYRVLTAGGDGSFAGTGAGADATLQGTILTQTVTPLTYDPSSGQTSSYLVTITAKVELVAHDGTLLYRNSSFAWREQYQSTQDLSGFVQEDGAAVRRMARDFSQALVSDMLESFR